MASLNSMQAGRDAESFDDRRKEGLIARSDYRVSPVEVQPLSPEKQAAVVGALAQIERAFGSRRLTTDRYIADRIDFSAEAA